MADIRDLKSLEINSRKGSTPLSGTMIIITIIGGHQFKYKGNIDIDCDSDFIHISATDTQSGNNRLYTWDRKVYDTFYFDQVISITGHNL